MNRYELIKRYEAGERDFSRVNLYGVNLSGINLTKINLTSAYLYKTNFSNTNLAESNFVKANCKGANFSNAILTNTNLWDINFTDVNLQGTCLDPQALIPETDLSELKTDGDYVIGYRTKMSIRYWDTTYESGKHYVAPWFSVCKKTECHPGIYLASFYWIKFKYPFCRYIKVKALKSETLNVGNKYRAKQIWVLEDV